MKYSIGIKGRVDYERAIIESHKHFKNIEMI